MAYKIRNVDYEKSTYSPEIQGSSSNPSVTYSTQEGNYVQIGDVVVANFIFIINTISGGSGDVRITLPFASESSPAAENVGQFYSGNVSFPASTVYQVVLNTAGNSYATLSSIVSGSTNTRTQISNLANGDLIVGKITYWV